MALRELEARYATTHAKGYKLTNREGLYLFVRANGSKLWRFKYRYAGKEKLLSFGSYPDTSLAEAQLRRAEAKVRGGSGNLDNGDEWIADLTAAMLAVSRRQDEQATAPESQPGVQGQGSVGCREGREDAGRAGAAV